MIYLHIPFCKQACSYCNFHFSTRSKGRDELLLAMQKELLLRQTEWASTPLQSIYFGGGTPSLLQEEELLAFFQVLTQDKHPQSPAFSEMEITLEANPDDLNPNKIAMLAASPVNRLSIGIQSFSEEDLRFMHRAHNAAEAQAVLANVQSAGFHNLSVDLIYGSPSTSDAVWEDNIRRVLDFGIPHISAYALTVEPKTVLAQQIKTGQVTAPSDSRFERQFQRLIELLGLAGYEHYEISNFALPGHYSRHNTAYWQGKSYTGIGPSAHSYAAEEGQRWWNIANNAIYTRSMAQIDSPESYLAHPALATLEKLSIAEQYNEWVMLGLRTQWGVQLQQITEKFGLLFADHFQRSLAPFVEENELVKANDGLYQLTEKGRQQADGIAAAAFWVG